VGAVSDNSTLSLTNVGSGQAGTYWVVVTNNYGSATSLVASLTLANSVGPTNVVSSPTEASLVTAIQAGGWVGIGFIGTLTLTNTINITNNVILDGSHFNATISGGNAVRLFYVAGGASLSVTNLILANGKCLVTKPVAGPPADAGAIYNNGGTVTLTGCVLANNSAQYLTNGGVARGGAIFNNGGNLSLSQTVVVSNSVVGGTTNTGMPFWPGTSGTGLGGAIYNTNGTVAISSCIVSNNLSINYSPQFGSSLNMGGAACQMSGVMTISNSSFICNQATAEGTGNIGGYGNNQASPAYGGAVAILGGNLSVVTSQFSSNQAIGGQAGIGTSGYDINAGPAFGGAVYCTATWTVADSTFSGNQAIAGNGIWAAAGASAYGGAIFNSGNMVLNRCSLFFNGVQGGSARGDNTDEVAVGGDGLGGAIFNSSQTSVTNCTIALNWGNGGVGIGATNYNGNYSGRGGNSEGAGVFNSTNASFTGMNLTIASNNCSAGTGLGGVGFGAGGSTNGIAAGDEIGNTNGTFSVHNSLIAYGTNSNAYGPITDVGYNICSDGSAGLFSGSSYNYTDPQLAPLGNYGGPTLCMALLASSPAIDNGDINGCPNSDQRGYIRPFGSGPDMGAHEFGSVPSASLNLSINMSSTNSLVSFGAFPPGTYYLQCSTNLTTWVNLSTNGPITVSTNISQTFGTKGNNRCYFRLMVQ
jgi:hypothetical protein